MVDNPKESNTGQCWISKKKNDYQKLKDFLTYLGLDPAKSPYPLHERLPFSFKVTKSFANKIQKKNWNDPLLKQVLPLVVEKKEAEGFLSDPVGDKGAQVFPGLIHKYDGRCLLLVTKKCPIHCRFCFRRDTLNSGQLSSLSQLNRVIQFLKEEPSIRELIFSGGEPLLISNAVLEKWMDTLAQISQLKTLRFHTRALSVFPKRVDKALARVFQKSGKRFKIVIVTHVNHGNEIDDDFARGANKLRKADVLLYNQSVLLRGINDTLSCQVSLCQSLLKCGITPYYLHQLDRVRGASHFEVDIKRGLSIYEGMRRSLPGYGLPSYVREIPGQKAKSPMIDYLEKGTLNCN